MDATDALRLAFDELLVQDVELVGRPLNDLLPALPGKSRAVLLSLAANHNAFSLGELWDSLDEAGVFASSSPGEIRQLAEDLVSLAERVRAPRRPAPRRAASFTDREALEAWAAEQGIGDRLRDPGSAILDAGVDAGTALLLQERGRDFTVQDAQLGALPPGLLEEAKELFRVSTYQKPRVGMILELLRRHAARHLDACANAVTRRREAEAAIDALLADTSPDRAHAVRFAKLCASARAEARARAAEPPPGLYIV